MSCYKPLLAVMSTDEVRKKNNPLRILPWTEETQRIYFDIVPKRIKIGDVYVDLTMETGEVEEVLHTDTLPINWKSKYFQPLQAPDGHMYKYVLCKCGQCIGCRLDHSREWATRCELEYKAYEELYGRHEARYACWFVTLTYNDDHLPIGSALEPTAVIKDTSDFMKNLREYAKRDGKVLSGIGNSNIDPEFAPQGLRFYATSDYGAKYRRPHYHMILFGLKQDMMDPKTKEGDLEYFFTNEFGDRIYHSHYLRNIWKKGFVDVGFFDWKTAAYTARYVVSKHKGIDSDYYDKHGIEPEVSRQSNRPGIGAIYYYLHENDIFKHDVIQLSDGRKAPVPRYFKKLYLKQFDDEEYELMSDDQKVQFDFMWNFSKNKAFNADANMYNELLQTDLDMLGYFKVKETKKKQEAKKLLRMLE